jgi:hypothetical protein
MLGKLSSYFGLNNKETKVLLSSLLGIFLALLVVVMISSHESPEIAEMEVHNVQYANGLCYVSVTNHSMETDDAQMRIAARDSNGIDWIIAKERNLSVPHNQRVTLSTICKEPPEDTERLWVRRVSY